MGGAEGIPRRGVRRRRIARVRGGKAVGRIHGRRGYEARDHGHRARGRCGGGGRSAEVHQERGRGERILGGHGE